MAQKPSATRQDPKPYQFTKEDLDRYRDRFWSIPRRLVAGGTWTQLWRGEGTKRGGGIASSILPVLALHTWPAKKNMDGANAGSDAERGWTGWTYLSRRRIARLAGVDKDAATRAMRRLQSLDLLQLKRVPGEKYLGGYRTFFRLAAELYTVDAEESFAEFQGNLIYGGSWSMLPTPAARHVYVVLACLDPIDDETAYLAKIEADLGGGLWEEMDFAPEIWDALTEVAPADLSDDHLHALWIEEIKREMLSRRRMASRVSLTELQSLTGLNRSTVIEAIQVLTKPIFGDRRDPKTRAWTPPIALIARGKPEPRRPTWYAPDRRARGWHWLPEVLNDPKRVAEIQSQQWQELPRRRARVASVLSRLADPASSAWDEACDLQNLKTRRARTRLPDGVADLAKATRLSVSAIEQDLKIAAGLTLAVREAANVGPEDLKLLSRTALMRVARVPEDERADALRDEVQRARERLSA